MQQNVGVAIDLVPPAAMAVLNLVVAVNLRARRARAPLPHERTIAACVLAPIVYGVAAFVAILLRDAAQQPWTPALAIAALGPLVVPLALAATATSPRALRALAMAAALLWAVVWIPALRPWGAEQSAASQRVSEVLVGGYLVVVTAVSLRGLARGGSDTGLERRLHAVAVPCLWVGAAWFLLREPVVRLARETGWMLPETTRRPVFSVSALVAGELMLLLLVNDRLEDRPVPRRRGALVQAALLTLCALLLLVVAMNLGLFPRGDPRALSAAIVVAAGLALAWGEVRPVVDRWLREALDPEGARTARRAAALAAELESARERLRAAEHLSLVGQLAAEVAHEIKNPLGPIKGYARVIERDLEARGAMSDVVARGIAVIREEVEAIDVRARRLLELARPPRPVAEPVDLGRAVDDVLDLLRADTPPGLRLAWRDPPPAAPAVVDRALLRSALTNVLDNARRALGERPGSILVSLARADGPPPAPAPPIPPVAAPPGEPASADRRPSGEAAGSSPEGMERVVPRSGTLDPGATTAPALEGPRWVLTVDDDGPGLPPDLDPEALFRPFSSRRPGGTGLGLVIARGALRSLGGDLRLERRAEGGARAVLTVPA